MSNLICPVCGKLFYGIHISKPCAHAKENEDGSWTFVAPSVEFKPYVDPYNGSGGCITNIPKEGQP
jgi:hypothetical protein